MKIKPIYVIIAVLLVFVAIEAKGLMHYDNVDENVYFYMGKLVSEGNMPYNDFFFAHPPLKILVNAAIFTVFGFSLFVLKLVPLLATIVSAIFIYKIMQKKFSFNEALIAMILFLFSYRVMAEATYALGINIATMFVVAGVYYLQNNKHLTSGLLFGLAAITGLYSLIPVTVIGLLILLKNRKHFIRFVVGFLAIFLTTNLLFIAIAGSKYIASVYTYHLIKPETTGNTAQLIIQALKQNWLIFGVAALGIILFNRKNILPIAVSVVYILFLTQLNRIFNFYFVLLFPFLVMLGGYAIVKIARKLAYKQAIYGGFLVLVAVTAGFTTSYLWDFDFVDFQTAKPMASFVTENSAFSDEIFGDMTATPLVALFSNRRIAFDMVDTNDMLFNSGLVNFEEVNSKIKTEKTKFVIINPGTGIGSFAEFKEFLEEDCVFAEAFPDKYWGGFLIYDCS